MLWGAVKDFDLTFIFGFSIKFYTHSCTFYQSAKVFSERFFLLAVIPSFYDISIKKASLYKIGAKFKEIEFNFFQNS